MPELELPPEADRIVMRAMAKSPEERYRRAAEVQAELEQALTTAGSRAMSTAARAAVAEAPTLSLEDSGTSADGSDSRARRWPGKDLADFERAMRRRRWLTRLALPLCLAAVVVGAFAVSRWRTEKPVGAEHEPNNTPGYANLLASGRPVRGAIGALIEGGHADIDDFRVPAEGGACRARAPRGRARSRPGARAVRRAGAAAREGRRAWSRRQRVAAADVDRTEREAFLAVREMRVEGPEAHGGSERAVRLHRDLGPAADGLGARAQRLGQAAATPVPPGTSIRGYLGHAEDKDWFAVTPATSGHVRVHVSVPAGVDVVLLQDGATKKTINKAGPGEDEEAILEAEAGRATLVGVARKPQRKSPKDDELAGLDAPYELEVTVE